MRADAIKCRLSPWIVGHAARAGIDHWVAAQSRDAARTRGTPADLADAIASAVAECTVARWLGVWWFPAPAQVGGVDVDATAVGLGPLEVKAAREPSSGLIVADEGIDGAHVLAHVAIPLVWLIGWIQKRDAMTEPWAALAREKLRKQDGRVWLVPADSLRSMRELQVSS